MLDEVRQCARLGRLDDLERWLDRFMTFQTELWCHGVFFGASNPFENHGVLEERLTIIDYSGLTDDPREIRRTVATVRARWTEQARGLRTLPMRPESAARFAQRLDEMLRPAIVRGYWPAPDDPRWTADGDGVS
jgi:hypothetical protein